MPTEIKKYDARASELAELRAEVLAAHLTREERA
jgi:hypothetical protein